MPEAIPLRVVTPAANPNTLVRWTDEEVSKIAAEIIRICAQEMKDPIDHRGYRRTIFEAQSVLPANRHRGLQSLQATKNLEPFQEAVKQIFAQRREAAEREAAERAAAEKKAREEAERVEREANQARLIAAQQQAAQPTPQPQPAPAPAPSHSSANPLSQPHGTGPASPAGHTHKHAAPPQRPVPNVHAQPEAEPSPDVGQDLNPPSRPFVPRQVEAELPAGMASGSIEAMIQTAAQMIGNTFVDAFMATLNARMAKEMPKLALRAMAVSKTLPKILVIGPLPKQQPALEEAVDGLVELKFVSSEERANLVGTRGKYCVGAVLWSNFVNHSHQAAMQKLFSSENFRIVTGTNLETLKQAVEDIAVQIAV